MAPILMASLVGATLSCNQYGADVDGDGYPSDLDCADNNELIHPGRPEICDGEDNDCNGMVDDLDAGLTDGTVYYPDFDADGFGAAGAIKIACSEPLGFAETPGDCDDGDAARAPDQVEVCGDDIDNDCSGRADCADDSCLGDATCVATATVVSPSRFRRDEPTPITITGVGFLQPNAGTTTVLVGGAPCTAVTVVSDTEIVCTTPALTAPGSSTVDVTVSNDHGSTTTRADAYECLWLSQGRGGVPGNLYCLDVVDGSWTMVTKLDRGYSSMGFDANGQLIGVVAPSSKIDPQHLTEIDVSTGAATTVGNLAITVPGLTVLGTVVYGWTESGDDLFTLDVAKASVSVVPVSLNTLGTSIASDGTDIFLFVGAWPATSTRWIRSRAWSSPP